MTAGFGNSAKFEDPNLERQADDRLAPFNEITRETVEWTKGTIAGRNQPYDKWIKQLKQFDKTSKCGRVWGSDYIAYRLEMFSNQGYTDRQDQPVLYPNNITINNL